jgi:hypothetical protein
VYVRQTRRGAIPEAGGSQNADRFGRKPELSAFRFVGTFSAALATPVAG